MSDEQLSDLDHDSPCTFCNTPGCRSFHFQPHSREPQMSEPALSMKDFFVSLAIALCVCAGVLALVYYSGGERLNGPRLHCGDTVFIDGRQAVMECRR